MVNKKKDKYIEIDVIDSEEEIIVENDIGSKMLVRTNSKGEISFHRIQISSQTPQTDNMSNEDQNSENIGGGTLSEESSSEGCGKLLDADDTTNSIIYCGTNNGLFLCDECKQKQEKEE